MLLAATHPAAVGEVFICGNREPTTLPEIARIVAAELGHKLTIVRLPASPFFLLAESTTAESGYLMRRQNSRFDRCL